MITRRTFLGTTSALVASSVVAADAAVKTDANGAYDFAAIEARLARDARHRQVFAVARVDDGAVVSYMNHGIDAYETAMGEGPGALHAAAVFYSRGVVLGLNDTMWQRYAIAEQVGRRGDVLTAASHASNPFAASLERLRSRGATLLVCDNALADWAVYLVTVAGHGERSPESLRAEFRRNLLPGALLVPAGVAALNDAQEHRFTFVQAS